MIAVWALTPMRPAFRRSSISAGDLIVRSSQMRDEQSLTSTPGKRSRRTLTNCISRVVRPSQMFRDWFWRSVLAFSVLASR